MNLSELQEKLQKDLVIDGTKLQYEASHNPVLYSKWLKTYTDAKKQVLALEHKKKLSMKQRMDFYTGRADEICPDVYTATELKTVLSADESVASIELKIQMYAVIIEFCSKALDACKQRGYSILNMVEIRKMENGG